MKNSEIRKTCSVMDCNEPHLAIGFCNRHYQQNKKNKNIIDYNYLKPNMAHFYDRICYIELRTIKGLLSGICMIDSEEAENILKHKWCISSTGYPKTSIKKKTIFLHTLIMKEKGIDHKDRDKMNNLKSNLRKCTLSENQYNRDSTAGTSIYKGVCFHINNKKYCVQIRFQGKTHWGGLYANERDAAIKYNELSKKYHGDFGVLNEVT